MKDQYGRTIDYLRISITDACNLRCRYCMPESAAGCALEQAEQNPPLTIEEMKTITPDAYFAAVDKMADMALADACTAANPRVPKKEDIVKIYTKLWSF